MDPVDVQPQVLPLAADGQVVARRSLLNRRRIGPVQERGPGAVHVPLLQHSLLRVRSDAELVPLVGRFPPIEAETQAAGPCFAADQAGIHLHLPRVRHQQIRRHEKPGVGSSEQDLELTIDSAVIPFRSANLCVLSRSVPHSQGKFRMWVCPSTRPGIRVRPPRSRLPREDRTIVKDRIGLRGLGVGEHQR